jgi:hypothetical protein
LSAFVQSQNQLEVLILNEMLGVVERPAYAAFKTWYSFPIVFLLNLYEKCS